MLEAYERKANTGLDLAALSRGAELQKPPRIKRLHTGPQRNHYLPVFPNNLLPCVNGETC